MQDKLFNLLLDSAKQTLDIAKGQAIADSYNVHFPDKIDTKTMRKSLNMTQEEFAIAFDFSLRTLQEWEQGRRVPDRSAKTLLKVISKDPNAVLNALKAA